MVSNDFYRDVNCQPTCVIYLDDYICSHMGWGMVGCSCIPHNQIGGDVPQTQVVIIRGVTAYFQVGDKSLTADSVANMPKNTRNS